MTRAPSAPIRTIALIARVLVRAVLLCHPREFRRRFAQDILHDITDDIQASAAAGVSVVARVATRSVVDAVTGIRTPQALGSPKETRHMIMITWLRDGGSDVRLALHGFRREPVFSLSEIAVIQAFLPQQMSEEETRAAIAAVVAATGAETARDMGKVMASLKAAHAGRMDFGKASGVVKAMLGG
jgi:hypothetical protein